VVDKITCDASNALSLFDVEHGLSESLGSLALHLSHFVVEQMTIQAKIQTLARELFFYVFYRYKRLSDMKADLDIEDENRKACEYEMETIQNLTTKHITDLFNGIGKTITFTFSFDNTSYF
jgi:hypothetical protein